VKILNYWCFCGFSLESHCGIMLLARCISFSYSRRQVSALQTIHHENPTLPIHPLRRQHPLEGITAPLLTKAKVPHQITIIMYIKKQRDETSVPLHGRIGEEEVGQ